MQPPLPQSAFLPAWVLELVMGLLVWSTCRIVNGLVMWNGMRSKPVCFAVVKYVLGTDGEIKRVMYSREKRNN